MDLKARPCAYKWYTVYLIFRSSFKNVLGYCVYVNIPTTTGQ